MATFASTPPPPPPPRSSPLKWILVGCCGVFMAGALCVGGCIFLLVKTTQPPVDASERFLKAMSGKNAVSAKSEVLPEYAEQVEPLLKAHAAAWGGTWSVRGRSINSNNGVTTATVTASVTGTDGKERVVQLGLKDSGGWKVMTVAIDGVEAMPSATLLTPESGGRSGSGQQPH